MPTWTTTRKKFYDCNDSQVIFPFTFPIGSEADIVVKVRTDADGAVVTLELTTDYTVSNAGGNWDSGGSVTTVATYATGKTLLIKRVTPKTQTKDYLEGDDFPAESHEEGIDKLTRIVQELQEEVWRCIKMPDTDDVDLDMEMPGAIDRAGRWLGFDAAGEPTIINIIRLYAILDFMVTFLESADAEAALAVLGIPADTVHLIDDVGEPAFENAWDNEGGDYELAGFYKDIDRFAQLMGRVDGGDSDTVIFTLPAGNRPSKKLTFNVLSEKRCYLEIDTNGKVKVVANPLDHADLLNIGTNTHAQIDTHLASTHRAWHKIDDPATGWLASKVAGWTADQFTPGGLAVDFSAQVPVGTLAVRVILMQTTTPSWVYYRKSGDANISNTPNASGEVSHLLLSPNEGVAQTVIWLSTDYKAQFAVTDVLTDLYIAYPIEYYK